MFKKLFLIATISTSALLASCSATHSSENPDANKNIRHAQSVNLTYEASTDVEVIIFDVALRNGIKPEAFRHMAKIESALNPKAFHPKSKACGLFQFIPKTANHYKLTDCRNPRANAEAAAKLWLDNSIVLKKALGSGLIAHSQKITVAARAMAERKAIGHRS